MDAKIESEIEMPFNTRRLKPSTVVEMQNGYMLTPNTVQQL